MFDDVLNRLGSLGYLVNGSDAYSVKYSIEKAESLVRSICNIKIIPKALRMVVIDLACGEFLKEKKNSGQLDMENINLSPAVSSIQEGDVSVSYAIGNAGYTPEQRLDFLIDTLLDKKECLYAFRCLKW